MVKASDTRQKILEAALDLFSQQGFHGTSIREIAAEVGIRKSSIYNYFSGKEDILEVIFIKFGAGPIKDKLESEEIRAKIEAPYELLNDFASLIMEIVKDPEEQKFTKIVLIEHNNELVRDMISEKMLTETRGKLMGIFEQMIEKGLIKEEEPLFLVDEFIGPLIFMRLEFLMLSYKDQDLSYIYEFIQKHVDFFWQAVKKE